MDFYRDTNPQDVDEKNVIGFILYINTKTLMTQVLEQKGDNYWVVNKYYKPNVIEPTNVSFKDIFKILPRNTEINDVISKCATWNCH